MTYTTRLGGDAVRSQAAVFPGEQSSLQICSKLDRRRGAVERPATGLRALPRRNPRSPKGHDENLPPALSRTRFIKEPCPRRAAPSRTVCHEAALLCLRISQSHPKACRSSHPPPPATPPEYSRVQVRRRRPHPRAHKCTKQAGGPHSTERGAGQGMTRQILSAAAPLSYICTLRENIHSGPTPEQDFSPTHDTSLP